MKNIEDILINAKSLEGKALSSFGIEKSKNKGLAGNVVEGIFGLTNDNLSKADFLEIGIDAELKTTPISVLKNGKHSPKERLVLSMINYNRKLPETFNKTHVFSKIQNTIILDYMHGEIKTFGKAWLLEITDEEWGVIEEDYKIIKNKIESGFAHTLSDSDTLFLSASRKGHKEGPVKYKGSDIPAKKRAWALKTTFMKRKASERYDGLLPQTISSLKLIHKNQIVNFIKSQVGKTQKELMTSLKMKPSKAKSLNTNIIRRLLKSKGLYLNKLKNREIFFKVQRLNEKGKLKEDISFKQVDFEEVNNYEFENTDLYNYMANGFSFILFDWENRLVDVKEVQFSDEDISKAKEGFEMFQLQLKNGETKFIKASDNQFIHLRPKGKNSKDTIEVNGKRIVKQSLWINKKEITNKIK